MWIKASRLHSCRWVTVTELKIARLADRTQQPVILLSCGTLVIYSRRGLLSREFHRAATKRLHRYFIHLFFSLSFFFITRVESANRKDEMGFDYREAPCHHPQKTKAKCKLLQPKGSRRSIPDDQTVPTRISGKALSEEEEEEDSAN